MVYPSEHIGRPDLRKRVIERLEHSIKMGGYQADEKLPTEHELATEFQVSRPIIRDVLQILRDKGLIYSRQGSGSYVKSSGYKPALSFSPVVTHTDFQSYYQFRLSIEPLGAELAATRMIETEIIQLSIHLKDLQNQYLPVRSRLNTEFQFHTGIAKASGNSFFSTVVHALLSQTMTEIGSGQVQHIQSEQFFTEIFNEQTNIYNALRNRDGSRANEAMKLHLSNALARFEASITL